MQQFGGEAFTDDFSDTDLDKYQVVVNDNREIPNWRAENGELVQDAGNDHNFLLVKNKLAATQVVETDLTLLSPGAYGGGYGGIVVWYHDENNWISVFLYPYLHKIGVYSNINGSKTESYYPVSSLAQTAYHLKVAANSDTGVITVFVDDSKEVIHTTNSIYRAGLSGVNCGNAGAIFDNLTITSFGTFSATGSMNNH